MEFPDGCVCELNRVREQFEEQYTLIHNSILLTTTKMMSINYDDNDCATTLAGTVLWQMCNTFVKSGICPECTQVLLDMQRITLFLIEYKVL